MGTTAMRMLVFLAIAALAALCLPGSVSATQRAPVTFETTGSIGADGHQSGSFTATGGMSDAGTFFFREDLHKYFHFGANGADTFGIAHSTEFFESPAGTFALLNTIKFTFSGEVVTVSGNWTVADGTGAYSRLRGNGTIIGTISGDPEVFAFTFSGNVDLT